ncbi:hypothetical protein J4Q44_G00088620 [Coregonus suidteri]|uniref:Uncharacterized protein n=1 Tax=Coregonus suidteri TaxID=861788 RepID=A0AAN8LW47_9TELE
MLQDGVVAEVVLVGGLDREGPLRSHPPHRLTHVECPHVLQLGQTNVQGTEVHLFCLCPHCSEPPWGVPGGGRSTGAPCPSPPASAAS